MTGRIDDHKPLVQCGPNNCHDLQEVQSHGIPRHNAYSNEGLYGFCNVVWALYEIDHAHEVLRKAVHEG
jgi:hypothetical protein